MKRCSETMQQIYKRTPMSKCDYWNRTFTWVFSCIFAACFQNTFSKEQLWRAALRLCVMQKALQLFFFLFSALFFCREFLYWETKVFWTYFIIFTQDVSDQYWTYSRDMECPLKIVHELKPKNWVFGSGRWTKHN